MPGSRRRNRNRRRNIRRRKLATRRMTTLPPSISMTSNYYRATIQTTVDVGNPTTPALSALQLLSIDLLLSHDRQAHYASLFTQCKLHRATAHYIPFDEQLTEGVYAMAFTAQGEFGNELTTGVTFEGVVNTPGSVVRRINKPTSLTWHPTDPDDRNWISVDGTHTYCIFALMCSDKRYVRQVPTASDPGGVLEITPLLNGKIIFELSMTFRGNALGGLTSSYCCGKCEVTSLRASISELQRRVSRVLDDDSDMEIVNK